MTKSKVAVPAEIRFLLCDEMRREETGKFVVIGFYPGEIVVLNNAVQDKEHQLVGLVPSLCLMFVASRGEGTFDANLRIVAPNGRVAFDQVVGKLSIARDQTATFAGLVRPFPVFAFGEHKATFALGKEKFSYTFAIREGQKQAIPGAQPQQRTPKRKTPIRAR